MKCPRCNIEGGIISSKYVTVNDDTAEKNTELYIEQQIACRNPNCADFGKVIKVVRNPLQLSKD